jgi:hypothetical protein
MGERIVFCAAEAWASVGARAVTELGATKDGDRWALIGDAEYLAIRSAGIPLPILYFTKEELAAALRDLDDAQTEEAILRRNDHFSPSATGKSVRRLMEMERATLVLAAVAAEGGYAGFDRAFDEGLWRITRLAGNRRYTSALLQAMFHYALEGDSRLVAEARSAPAPARDLGAALEASRRYGSVYAQILTELGRLPEGAALLHVNVERVLFIRPADDDILERLHTLHQPHIAHGGGVIAPWPLRMAQSLVDRGKQVEVLFPSLGELHSAIDGLTEAQQKRELDERLTLVQTAGPAFELAHWNGARVAQAALRRSLMERARAERSPYLPHVEAHVAEEALGLRAGLAGSPSWIHASPIQAASWLEPMLAAVQDEAAFFSSLATLDQNEGLRDDLATHAWLVSTCRETLRAR